MCTSPGLTGTSALTLVDVQEGLAQPAGEDRLGQVSEVLLHHVGHVERGLAVVGDAVRIRLHQVTQVLDTRLHPRLPEKTHLREQDRGVSLCSGL